ncbi:ATP-binding protein [Orlajensenia flava]|uniref:ATP-binding protein n=1 Tax=Orlajensenia flava TaxID=2565934 RepID=UPI001455437C|nr:ATP-binding protein [Glaciibacter flavus]
MLTDDEVSGLISTGYEQRNTEFKSSGSLGEGSFRAKVARAAIALANQRDGGRVIIGVSETDGIQNGLSMELAREYEDFDTVVDRINTYADPPLRLDVTLRTPFEGVVVAVIEVAEFDEIPVLCKRQFGGVLVQGQLYTRSMAKPESSASHTQNELRALLAVAVEKGLSRFIETARRGGVDLIGPVTSRAEAQLAEALESQLFARVVVGPHLLVRFAPVGEESDVIEYDQLAPIVAGNQVSAAGWRFPIMSTPSGVQRGQDWFGDLDTSSRSAEAWQFFQSGVFVLGVTFPEGFSADWESVAARTADEPHVPIWFLIAYVTMTVEFAARLQRAAFNSLSLDVQLSIANAEGWVLSVSNPSRAGFHSRYSLTDGTWTRTITITPENALTSSREIAASVLRHMLVRFGWDGVTDEIILGVQDETLGAEV